MFTRTVSFPLKKKRSNNNKEIPGLTIDIYQIKNTRHCKAASGIKELRGQASAGATRSQSNLLSSTILVQVRDTSFDWDASDKSIVSGRSSIIYIKLLESNGKCLSGSE